MYIYIFVHVLPPTHKNVLTLYEMKILKNTTNTD